MKFDHNLEKISYKYTSQHDKENNKMIVPVKPH